jgi:phage tail sheath gpL-like
MTISFNEIPPNMRVPGFYHEFDPSRANTGQLLRNIVVLGQRLTTGTVAAGVPITITRPSDAGTYFGRGSMLEQMLKFTFKVRPNFKVTAIALDDLPAGIAATGKYAVTGAMSTNATMVIEAAGEIVKLGVAAAATQDQIASAVVAAINAQTDFPVTAAVNGTNANEVDITARHKGEYGNDVLLDVVFEAGVAPTSPSVTITNMAGGTGNPDIQDAIAAMGDDWYNWIVTPWTDSANMMTLEAELADRFGPIRQIGARAFCAFPGTYGAAAAYGDSRNSAHVSCIGTGLSKTPPWCWASINAMVAANSLAIDPARQVRTLALPGVKAPAKEYQFNFNERDLLLFDGISTYTVDSAGIVLIEAQITMYQENTLGLPDDSMLYINVPELTDARRLRLAQLFAPFARDKLMDDGNDLPIGQPVMTPSKARALLQDEYKVGIKELAWYEDYASWAETLLVEKQGNRLAVVDQPNYVENFRQLFMRSELVI